MAILMPRQRYTYTAARRRQWGRYYPDLTPESREQNFNLWAESEYERLGAFYIKGGDGNMGAFDNFEWDEEAQSGAEGEAYDIVQPVYAQPRGARPYVGTEAFRPEDFPPAGVVQAGAGAPLLLAGGAALARYGPTLVARLRALVPAMTPAVRNLLISMGLIGTASAAGSAIGSMAGDEIGEAPGLGEGESVGPFDIARRMLGGGPGGPPGLQVAYTWDTGTAIFYRLTDGRIAVQRKNGVWKFYRPQKHIVVPRNPRIGTLLRADRRIDRLMRGLARRSKKLKVQR